jgi:hypothetical protein
MAYAMEEETTMMIPPQGMDEDMGEGIASLPEQGNSGIVDLPQAAQQLAQLGRAQDTFLGHLEQDEVVIPSELLQASPELEDMIRNAFEAEGMDYSRYVVGSDENSINPETGLPEFNPFKKLERAVRKPLKKAGRKIEKAVRKPVKKAGRQLERAVRKPIKKVARELKRAAPVVLPIALTLLAGPQASLFQQMLLSGAGSGISTLVAGGNFKDALKNAAISAALTGAISGTQKALAPKELAQTGAQTQGMDLVNPTNIAAQTPKSVNVVGSTPDLGTVTEQVVRQDPVSNPFQYTDSLTPPASPTGTVYTPPSDALGIQGGNLITDQQAARLNLAKQTAQQFSEDAAKKSVENVAKQSAERDFVTRIKDGYETTKDALGTAYDATKSGLKKVGDFIYPTGEGSKRARDELMAKYIKENKMGVDAAKFLANKETGYSALRQFGPATALGIAGLKASGAFGGAEEEESEEARAFREQLAEDRAIAANIPQMGSPAGIDYITGAQTLAGAPNYQYLNPLYQGGYFLNNPAMNNPTLTTGVAMARRGGEMAMTNLDTSKFPRRTGRISGPGTETSDSIPAMLSDGEFVMNARAVRGAGNGSREAGVRKMYDMMRNFESKVA